MRCPGSNLSNELSYKYPIQWAVREVTYPMNSPTSILSTYLFCKYPIFWAVLLVFYHPSCPSRILSTELSSKYPMKCLVSILSNEMSCKYPMNHYECHTSILSNELSCEYSFQLAFPQVSYPLSSPPKFASILFYPVLQISNELSCQVYPMNGTQVSYLMSCLSSILIHWAVLQVSYPLSCPTKYYPLSCSLIIL